MIVACCLVNRTTWEKARLVHARLKLRYRTPKLLAVARPEDLHDVLRPLGLWRQRSNSLVKLAQSWYYSRPETADDVKKLPGCGKYAADSWAIFIGNRSDVEPNDGKLNWYLSEKRASRSK